MGGGLDFLQRRKPAIRAGLPQISAPRRSAAYSLVREIAICTSMAAKGATIIATSTPTKPKELRPLSREPPKKKAKLPSMEIAPAMVAVMVMSSVSRLSIWVGQFMRHHAGGFLGCQALQKPGGCGHGGIFRGCGRWQRHWAGRN